MKQKYQIGDSLYVLNGRIFKLKVEAVAVVERYLNEDNTPTDTFRYCFNSKKIFDNEKSIWFEEKELYTTKEALLDNLSNSIA